MADLISIVIPVYNVEKYLSKCIESVIGQSFKNIEIILVNDGSTDQSGKICDKYAKKDTRIIVYHKENGGLSDARNYGIKRANGKYITFIDSDDYISKQYVEVLYTLLITNHAQISICNLEKFKEGSLPHMQSSFDNGKTEIFSGIEAMELMFYQKKITNSAFAKMYLKKLFDNIEYPKGKLYEDLATTYKLFYLSNKIVYNPAELYYYLIRKNSIMNRRFDEKNFDRIYVSEEILDFVENNCSEIKNAAISRYVISNVQVLREIPLDKKYVIEINNIKKNISKFRDVVSHDKKAKLSNRIISKATCLPFKFLQALGVLYKRINP